MSAKPTNQATAQDQNGRPGGGAGCGAGESAGAAGCASSSVRVSVVLSVIRTLSGGRPIYWAKSPNSGR